jgi:hypothetical protein
LAILIATLEAAIESGLVEPLYMSVEDNAGTIKRSTIQQGVSYDDDNVGSDVRFPLRVVNTDEADNGKLDVSVETEEIGDGWIFRTHVSWLK